VVPEHVSEADAGRLRCDSRVHVVRPPEAPLRQERGQRGAAELLGLENGGGAHGRRGALSGAVQEPRLGQRHRHERPRGREHGDGRRRMPRRLGGRGRGGLSHEAACSSSLLGTATNRSPRSVGQHGVPESSLLLGWIKPGSDGRPLLPPPHCSGLGFDQKFRTQSFDPLCLPATQERKPAGSDRRDEWERKRRRKSTHGYLSTKPLRETD